MDLRELELLLKNLPSKVQLEELPKSLQNMVSMVKESTKKLSVVHQDPCISDAFRIIISEYFDQVSPKSFIFVKPDDALLSMCEIKDNVLNQLYEKAQAAQLFPDLCTKFVRMLILCARTYICQLEQWLTYGTSELKEHPIFIMEFKDEITAIGKSALELRKLGIIVPKQKFAQTYIQKLEKIQLPLHLHFQTSASEALSMMKAPEEMFVEYHSLDLNNLLIALKSIFFLEPTPEFMQKLFTTRWRSVEVIGPIFTDWMQKLQRQVSFNFTRQCWFTISALNGFEGLSINVCIPDDLKEVVDREHLKTYNKIFAFLLTLQNAKFKLNFQGLRNPKNSIERFLFQQFVNAVLKFWTSIISTEYNLLFLEIKKSKNFLQLSTAHLLFLTRIREYTLLDCLPIYKAIRKMLDLVIEFTEQSNPEVLNLFKLSFDYLKQSLEILYTPSNTNCTF